MSDDTMSIAVDTRNIFTIAQLNQRARDLLEGEFPAIWVEGEISNLVAPSSGHLYFTLKDSQAQVRAAMFRGNNRYLTYSPRNGLKVLVRCRVSLYPARGDYQLIVELMEESGEGALRRAFELLKQKLAGEGLFDASLKQLLPSYPEHVGVVTSPTGAAIKDILSVFKRRFPATEISILPVVVQGEDSAAAIAQAIKKANQLKLFDVLIVGRGGGSLEDLWAFNEEIVARAIFASKIPVVSAVGHEIDFTISDLVADIRAPTPSAAAELLSPDQGDIQTKLRNTEQSLLNAAKRNIALKQLSLKQVKKRLKHPGQTLQEQTQRLDRLEVRLKKAALSTVSQQNIRLTYTENRLFQNSPQTQIA
ncbi:MAG: exodeoxyribonuclease VII large subunit, partial [Gammaproteobacteria bacterium]|nr:exodeoxyribonuclease VII large subunit [Gammaproteobacteria bacterium]